jgi:hypothetical protein
VLCRPSMRASTGMAGWSVGGGALASPGLLSAGGAG